MLLKLWRHFFFLTEDIFKPGFITQGYFNYKLLSHLHSIVMISHLCLCPEANKEESSFVSKTKEICLHGCGGKGSLYSGGMGPPLLFLSFGSYLPPSPAPAPSSVMYMLKKMTFTRPCTVSLWLSYLPLCSCAHCRVILRH